MKCKGCGSDLYNYHLAGTLSMKDYLYYLKGGNLPDGKLMCFDCLEESK